MTKRSGSTADQTGRTNPPELWVSHEQDHTPRARPVRKGAVDRDEVIEAIRTKARSLPAGPF